MAEDAVPSVQSIIGAVAAKHGILLKPGDAAFAMVTINEMLLERSVRELADQIDKRLKDFETSFERLQTRAGRLLAQDVKEAAAEIRTELQRDIDTARVNASKVVHKAEVANTRWSVTRWAVLGILCGAVLFLAGFLCGSHHFL